MADRPPNEPKRDWITQGLYEEVAGGIVTGIIFAVVTALITRSLWVGLLFAVLAGVGAILVIRALAQGREPSVDPSLQQPARPTDDTEQTSPLHPTQLQPPVTRTIHPLPFDKLSPHDFERLCLWLVEREGYEHAEHLGAAGSEQGRDVVAWRDGRLWAFQCKRVRTFGPSDAHAEIDKILSLPSDQRPVGLVFVVTCNVSANTREQALARLGDIECHFWTGTELDEKVKQHPDIVQEFFLPLAPTPAPPSIPSSLHQLPPPPADFTGCETELAKLCDAIQHGGVTISGVRGMGGIGKTVLALELAQRLADHYPDAQISLDLKGTDPDPLTPADAMAKSSAPTIPPLPFPTPAPNSPPSTAPSSTASKPCC
jgi:hypothetical protein